MIIGSRICCRRMPLSWEENRAETRQSFLRTAYVKSFPRNAAVTAALFGGPPQRLQLLASREIVAPVGTGNRRFQITRIKRRHDETLLIADPKASCVDPQS